MQSRTRSNMFVRSMVDAVTVRPMLSALLEMKRARLRSTVVEVAPAAAPVVEVAPLKAA